MRLPVLLWCVLGFAALSGCQDDNDSTPALRNTKWMLVQVESTPIAVSSYSESFRSYVQFSENDVITGLGPCNSFEGKFSTGRSNQLFISKLATTKVNCAALSLETLFLEALPRTAGYELSGQELRLYDASNVLRPLVILRAQQ